MIKKDKISWCLKKYNGIQIIEENENLKEAYLIKAKQSFESMQNEISNEWKISKAYYTLYYSVYAILMKIGIKCEIHSCTIEFLKLFLIKKFNFEDIKLLENSFELRNKVQYYICNDLDLKDYEKLFDKIFQFYVKCKEIANNLTQKEIIEIKNNLKKYKK